MPTAGPPTAGFAPVMSPRMDEDGYVKIVDRAKDLVKSGGEWISSVDLENTLMGHPAVKEAAWSAFRIRSGRSARWPPSYSKDGMRHRRRLRAFLAKTFAKWQLPDAFVFVDAIPRTSVGKFKKLALRQQFANWNWQS